MSLEQTNDSQDQSFTTFNFRPELLEGVLKAGFTVPTPVQKEAIPQVMNGADVVAQAGTGTGKTAAFALPILNKIERSRRIQALVVTPTRELAIQVSDEFNRLGENSGLRSVPIYGGQAYEPQLNAIRRGAQIIVATPGRLLDVLKANYIKNFSPEIAVLDEADEMLNMGFLDDVRAIFGFLPENRQTLLFSATMPPQIRKLASDILNEPVEVRIKTGQMTSLDVEQFYCVVPERDRSAAVVRLLDAETPEKAIIFARTKKDVDELCRALLAQKYRVRSLHGDINQRERQEVVKAFRSNALNTIVATDVAARGLDITGVTHVINYHLPVYVESYVHRVGRTGRAGEKGKAFTIVSPQEVRRLHQFQSAIKTVFRPCQLPTLTELRAQRESAFLQEILDQGNSALASERVEQLAKHDDMATIAIKLMTMLQRHVVAPLGAEQIGYTLDDIKHSRNDSGRRPRDGRTGHHRSGFAQRRKQTRGGSSRFGGESRRGERDDSRKREQNGDRGYRGQRNTDRNKTFGRDQGGERRGRGGGRNSAGSGRFQSQGSASH